MNSNTRPRPPPEVLTAYLQTCLCVRGLGEGVLCKTCGCHGEVGTHNTVCTENNCAGVGSLLACCGCNMAYHRVCMGNIRWGLDDARNDAPWCEECFDEWSEVGVATANQRARGDTTIAYAPVVRPDGPAAGANPLLSPPVGRRRVRYTRAGPEAARNVVFVPCRRGVNCLYDCNRVSLEDR